MHSNGSTTCRSSTQGQAVVFWLLIALGLTGLTPCVLLPEWRQYEVLVQAEQIEARRLDGFQSFVERERAAYEALCSDPAVVARLAQRELGYARPGEQTVRVVRLVEDRSPLDESPSVSGVDNARAETASIEHISLPPFVAQVLSALPALDYDAVFCDDRERSIIMTMSLALIMLAVVLFGHKRVVRVKD